jgi:K+-sensing histidine kinase KdpD
LNPSLSRELEDILNQPTPGRRTCQRIAAAGSRGDAEPRPDARDDGDDIAHAKSVGSIIIGHSRHGRLHQLLPGSIVQKLLRLASDVDVHVVADR